MNAFLMEQKNMKVGIAPVDGNTAAMTGARVAVKDARRIAIAIFMGASTAAVVDVSLKQHNAATGGTTKALPVANAYFHKAGAATSFTKVEPTVAADNYNLASVFAADGGVLVFEVLEDQLDVNGNFSHISVDIADTTAAKLLTAVYILNADALPAYSTAL